MKKAIGIILLWVIGGVLGGVPVWLIATIAIGTFAACYLGVYHKFIGVGAGLTFVWGLGVLAFNLPKIPSLYEKTPTAFAEAKHILAADYKGNNANLKAEVASIFTASQSEGDVLLQKLKSLDRALENKAITLDEYTQMRVQILNSFSQEN